MRTIPSLSQVVTLSSQWVFVPFSLTIKLVKYIISKIYTCEILIEGREERADKFSAYLRFIAIESHSSRGVDVISVQWLLALRARMSKKQKMLSYIGKVNRA